MDWKKLLSIGLLGLGVYLLISRRKVYAEEIPTGVKAETILSNLTLSPAIQQKQEVVTTPEKITPPPEICRKVRFISMPSEPIRFLTLIAVLKPIITEEAICAPNLEMLEVRVRQRAQELKASFRYI